MHYRVCGKEQMDRRQTDALKSTMTVKKFIQIQWIPFFALFIVGFNNHKKVMKPILHEGRMVVTMTKQLIILHKKCLKHKV